MRTGIDPGGTRAEVIKGQASSASLSPYSQRVKKANPTWLNGPPLDKDLAQALKR